MIALASSIALTVAIFGVSAATLAFREIAVLEVQQATEEAALAAAGRASFLVTDGASQTQVDAAVQDEASSMASANIARSSFQTSTATTSSDAQNLVMVDLTVTSEYAGLGARSLITAHSSAFVRRP